MLKTSGQHGIDACGFDDEEIEQGSAGPRDEQVHENRAAVVGQIQQDSCKCSESKL